jgi:hypothetical protein
MLIESRQDFMRRPAGTIYCKGKPWFWEQICVKGDTLFHDGKAADWCYRDWAWVSASDSEQAIDRLTLMAEANASFPIEDTEGRDGCFDEQDLFLIFEPEDLAQMAEDIAKAIATGNLRGETKIS